MANSIFLFGTELSGASNNGFLILYIKNTPPADIFKSIGFANLTNSKARGCCFLTKKPPFMANGMPHARHIVEWMGKDHEYLIIDRALIVVRIVLILKT